MAAKDKKRYEDEKAAVSFQFIHNLKLTFNQIVGIKTCFF
jgi:hypothetical protein